MRVSSANRRVKCAGDVSCENKTVFKIKFSKAAIYLCDECARALYKELGKNLVPRSIKSKFNLEN